MMSCVLRRSSIPGLFITATDTNVGKTVITGAIAQWFRTHARRRVAVSKPVASGCVRRREGLVSEDAEYLAVCADTPHPLDVICPERYEEPLAPAIAAQRAGRVIDWSAVQWSIDTMSTGADVLLVEGAGGILVPLDAKTTVLDLVTQLDLPAVVVARPGLGTINHTVLTVDRLRSAGVRVAGVVINRYPAGTAGVAEETAPRWIEKLAKTQVLCLVPECATHVGPPVPPDVMAAIEQVDWDSLISPPARDRR
jgi:dethiobiotin synthetase